MEVHFLNLSRGALCPCGRGNRPDVRYVRIQSTACEQKRWGPLLDTLGAGLLMPLARGSTCVVHDCSERERVPRSIWQGVEWIRWVCEAVWNRRHTDSIVRGGHNAKGYWAAELLKLPDTTVNMLRYYRRWREYAEGTEVRIEGCPVLVGRYWKV